MKKKILVFMLLFAFLVGVGVPEHAKAANSTETTADDVKYRDIEDFMHSSGYMDFSKKEDCFYFVFDNGTNLNVVEFTGFSEGKIPYACYLPNYYNNLYFMPFPNTADDKITFYKYYNRSNASSYDNYGCLEVSSGWGFSGRTNINDVSNCYFNFPNSVEDYRFSYLIYSDLDVYSNDNNSGKNFITQFSDVLYESNLNSSYSFPSWCDDAGLNSISSSNESPSVIPYSYNSYWHIVRKTISGKWLLTTVGNSVSADNASDYTFVYSEDMGTLKVFNLYSGEDINGYLLNVRQYEYDTDGWKVRTFETFDARETEDNYIDLGAGSGVDDTRVLAYTSVNIYDEGFNLVTPASTEYIEPTTPEVTPEPTPGSGSSGSGDSDDTGSSGGSSSGSGGTVVGGDAKPGGLLEFFVTLVTLVWTDLFAVEVPVDGYSISFQAIVIWGAVAGLLIWGGCKLFGKKG